MRRALTVIVVAILTAVLSGIHDPSMAAEEQQAQLEGHRQVIATQVQGLPVGTAVRIDMIDGRHLDGVIEQVNADSIVAIVSEGRQVSTQTVAFADIKRIQSDKVYRRHKRNIAIGTTVAIGAGLFATCSICVANSGSLARSPRATADKPNR
jgi:uncharacterized membrane protein affecting hemolysin expression